MVVSVWTFWWVHSGVGEVEQPLGLVMWTQPQPFDLVCFSVQDRKKLQLSSCSVWPTSSTHSLISTDFETFFFSVSQSRLRYHQEVFFFPSTTEIHTLTKWDKDELQGEKEFCGVLTSDKRLMLGQPLWRKSTIITIDGYHRSHLLIRALRLTSPSLPLVLSFILMGFFLTHSKAGLTFCKYRKEICIF